MHIHICTIYSIIIWKLSTHSVSFQKIYFNPVLIKMHKEYMRPWQDLEHILLPHDRILSNDQRSKFNMGISGFVNVGAIFSAVNTTSPGGEVGTVAFRLFSRPLCLMQCSGGNRGGNQRMSLHQTVNFVIARTDVCMRDTLS